MDFKEYLISELSKMEDISEPFIEKKNVRKTNQTESDVERDVSNEEIMEYLVSHGYELTQDNYQQAKSVLSKGGGTNHEYNLLTVETINHLNDLSEEQLKILIDLALLKDNRKPKKVKYTYAVETVLDNRRGTTDYVKMKETIEKYSSKGYRLISCFTNEAGHNSSDVTIGSYTSGTNATIDQVVLIFEKAVSID